ncbi:sirohydrochlorin chelatase [Salinactinospora qingdaonensis]|uniref:Sirohydrochlorin ferrochelatase n=1 Tax=Salinactinospora qingdaonensis TaxID=702744 RepID=A0ABP7GJH8_9ACTN
MNPETTRNSEQLPPRDLPRRRSGRHRNPLSYDSSVGNPALVLAIPGHAETSDGTGIGSELADLVRVYRPEVTIRYGYTEGNEFSLAAALDGMEGSEENTPSAVVVPVLTAPHQVVTAAITAAVTQSGAHTHVTEVLGPHPMLAEVLHLRLAESGFVRADRMRLINVVAAGTGMADGVIVGSVGGTDAESAAGVTAVLLAARLGITVLPAALDDHKNLGAVLRQLRDAGATRPVIAPNVVGPEFSANDIAVLADKLGVGHSAPLGATSTLAKIAALRYAEVLNSLGAEQPPTIDELPNPVGSRHRPES